MKTINKVFLVFANVMLIFFSATGQIIYTDINPDGSIAGGQLINSYSLDLNNDGTVDYIVKASQVIGDQDCPPPGTMNFDGSADLTLETLGINKVADSVLGLVQPLDSNAIIDSALFNIPDTGVHVLARIRKPFCSAAINQTGFWSHSDKYVGLQLHVRGFIYYGWAHLKTVVSTGWLYFYSTCLIKDYAYYVIANHPLRAGQIVVTDINEAITSDEIVLYPNPANEYFKIVLPAGNVVNQIEIMDLCGEKIYSSELQKSSEHEINTEDFKPGIYFAKISGPSFSVVKKLVIEKR